ncbi:hypothetical protein GGI24_005848, partial [Coemansia furcata]
LPHDAAPFDAATLGDYATSSSFKPSLWPFGDDVNVPTDETRSLADMRARDVVDLHRPASSTPTGLRHPPSAATAPSPVAPRSAASTPGRREAVGL